MKRYVAIVLAAATVLVAACATDNPASAPTPTASAEPPAAATAERATATHEPTPLQIDFAAFYADNCAVCHAADRSGVGRAVPLTPRDLTEDVDDYLAATEERTHNPIWTRTGLVDTERRSLIEYLASVPP